VPRAAIDSATGVLKVAGKAVFPIGLTLGPPPGVEAPSGKQGLAEVAAAGVTFVRTGIEGWGGEFIDGQIANERRLHAAAHEHGLACWLWLGRLGNLPQPPGQIGDLLTKVVNAFKGDPALLAWKGVDEPRNPFRGDDWIRPAGLVRAHDRIHALDGDHPVVIVQAPPSPVSQLTPYRPAFDVTGADVYPVGYPPGAHVGSDNHDLSLVGDVTKKLRSAAGAKPVWMTLQIAWSGVAPTTANPFRVPRFPSLHDERFMAYQAIANGARGLTFFGGHLTQVATPDDAMLGWNWTFWARVLKPLLRELRSPELAPALVAADVKPGVTTKPKTAEIELVTRRAGGFLYVIAARRGGSGTTSEIGFTGLPRKNNGQPNTSGRVLFEYTQQPPPPPIVPGKQNHRPIRVENGVFKDWFAPHDVHVYRFAL
jgi:hypothetical protein